MMKAEARAHTDISPSAIAAGFLAVLVSYAGPLLIYYKAATAMGVSAAAFSSWIMAISVAAGVAGIVLSLRLRAPIVTAWSAPGTALLITLGPGTPFAEVVGAFIVAALIIMAVGLSGMFDRLVRLMPPAVASGMMAGILFQFGVGAFESLETAPLLFAVILGTYMLARLWDPRYSVLILLPVGIAVAAIVQDVDFAAVSFRLAEPSLTVPALSLDAVLGIAIPLVVVTLSGQFLPGMAILQVSGYRVSARRIITTASLTSLAAALFGGITTALASITAALCTGRDAHPDPAKRYIAGIANGAFYLIGGVLSGTVVTLLDVLPEELIAMLAGFALLGAIGASLDGMVKEQDRLDAGLVTFLVTVSGVVIGGIGSAFWGLVIGLLAHRLGAMRTARHAPVARQADGG